MTVTLAIALNAIADLALLGGLGWLMTRPGRLPAHVSTGHRLSLVHGATRAAEHSSGERIAA